ncbi:class I SAM-dependent methyltransferase [Actinopolyspora mortivallis]|uniref:class I SAM-dependent methyltransferase n=1 Tax=Actinopolyspora mortivallis TaxID=33906 RepID=UPI00037D5A4F|nr:methyltransferase domain-containing protein [Actinopolyspora mortivallis]
MTAQHHGKHVPRRMTDSPALAEYRRFFATALRNPTTVGAATPTSKAVARTVARFLPTTGSPTVVELGPGTGSLSDEIHTRLPATGRHVGIELNEDLVRHLRARIPGMESVHADARELRHTLTRLGVDSADAIVSSIPWSLLAADVQRDILDQCRRVLTPEGRFTALACLPMQHSPGGKRFRAELHSTFAEVGTRIVWRNLPPLLHYACTGPLPERD